MNNVEALYGNLDYQGAMKQHLVMQNKQFIAVTEELGSLETELFELGQKRSDLHYQVNSPWIREEPDPRIIKQLAEVQAEYDQLNKKKEQLLRRQQQINDDINLQEETIANNHLLNKIALKEAHKHLKNINLARAEVDRIIALIQDQTPLINSLIIAELLLQSLLLQKEDILADIEIGRNCGQELTEIDQQIALVMANIEQAQEVGDKAKATQLGLERKLEEAKQALAALEGHNGGIKECLLHGMAEEAGQDYFKIANELQKAFTRLMGLNSVIMQQSPKRNGICLNQQGLRIPSFNLDCAKQYKHEPDGSFFDWEQLYRNGDRQAMEAILQELRNANVTII